MATSEEIAWAAGLFEGEGSVTLHGNRLAATMKLTDHDVLQHLQAVLQTGRIYGPYQYRYPDRYTRKPFWFWQAHEARAYAVIEAVAPWLHARRAEQVRRVLACIGAMPPTSLGDMANISREDPRPRGASA